MKQIGIAGACVLSLWSSAVRAEWQLVETPHVEMRGDAPVADMQRLAGDLEALDALMTKVTGVTRKPSRPVVIYVFASNSEAQALTGLSRLNGGLTQSSPEGPQIVAAAVASGGPNSLRRALFHEYAHAFRSTQLPGPRPLWFDEGFATFFESVTPQAGAVLHYGPNAQRREELREVGYTSAATILALDPASTDGPPAIQFYDTGWLIVHHMMSGGARRSELDKFIAVFASGDLNGSLEPYFAGGTAAFDHDLLADANSSSDPENTLAVTPATAMTTRPLATVEIEMLRFIVGLSAGAAANTTREQFGLVDHWLDQLDTLGAKYPGDASIARAAANIGIKSGSVARVLPLLDKALALHADDPALLGLRGAVVTILADQGEVEKFDAHIADAARSIDRALKLDPSNPEALRAKARNLRAKDGASAEVVAYLERALALNPLDSNLRDDLAETYYRIGDKKHAITTLLPIVQSDPNPVIRRRARHSIAALRAGYPYQ